MSVLVKGMDLPGKCNECQFCVNEFTEKAPVYECAALGAENVSVLVDDHGKPFDFRPDWCPLVEIPTPHGRLVDIDDAIESYGGNAELEYVSQAKFLNVIIDAEGEG